MKNLGILHWTAVSDITNLTPPSCDDLNNFVFNVRMLNKLLYPNGHSQQLSFRYK